MSHLNGLAAAGAAGSVNLNYQYLMGTFIPPLQPFVPQPQTNQNHHHQHFQPPPPSSLSLWMGQDIAQPQPQPQDYDWVFGNAKAASACIDNNNTHDEHITQNANASLTTTTTLYVPSLFSNDQPQNANANSNVNMSATALLQKAAEIGATSTTTAATNDPSTFLQSFPLKSSDQTTTYDGGEKFFALYGSNNNIGLMSHSHDHQEIENPRNDVMVASALDELQNYPWKRRRVDGGGEGAAGGQTRDFLGVGVQTLCHPSSINGWI